MSSSRVHQFMPMHTCIHAPLSTLSLHCPTTVSHTAEATRTLKLLSLNSLSTGATYTHRGLNLSPSLCPSPTLTELLLLVCLWAEVCSAMASLAQWYKALSLTPSLGLCSASDTSASPAPSSWVNPHLRRQSSTVQRERLESKREKRGHMAPCSA